MGLHKPTHLCTLPLLVAFAGVSIAGTLSGVNMQATGMFNGGTPTGCGDGSFSYASCSFLALNTDVYGGEGANGDASASSAFGALSGAISVGAGQNRFGYNSVSVQGRFSAEFNDAVVVTGATGTGTLVADFSWNADATVNATSEAFWPAFTAVVGSSSESWTATANLPYDPGVCAGPVPCTGSGNLDVSASFTFGGLVKVDGSTAVGIDTTMITGQDFPISLGQDGDSSASLTLEGFSVYDASGNLVPGAVVTPVLTPAPEPGSISLLLFGVLVLWVRFARFHSQDRPHHSTFHA